MPIPASRPNAFRSFKSSRLARWLAPLFAAAILPACSDDVSRYAGPIADYRLQSVPSQALGEPGLRRPLDEILREPCDRSAAAALSRALASAGYRREAASVLVGFAGKCPQGKGLLPGAIPILAAIGDVPGALDVANRVVAEDDTNPQLRFMRAEVLREAARYAEALDDYLAVLALASQPARVSSEVFLGAAQAQAETGNPCEASALVRMWVSGEPARRDTPRARALAARYAQQGNCKPDTAATRQTFLRPRSGVIMARVRINGQEGNFVVDTGASFVSVNEAFASRAGLGAAAGRRISLQTANGIRSAVLGEAGSIAIGTAQASRVPTAVLSGGQATFGPGIDGLLGQSFLSRFDVSFQQDRWTIGQREAPGR